MAHSQHVRLQAETDPLIRAFEEASEALKDGDDTTPRHADSTGMSRARLRMFFFVFLPA